MGFQVASTVGTPRLRRQDGIALITTMMVMMLVTVLMIGFVAAIVSDNRASGLDRDQTQAYAATHAGLEKLTSDLSVLFTQDFSPSAAQITALTATPPVVSGFQYLAPDNTSGYTISFTPDGSGNPQPIDPILGTTISAGPFSGFQGIITKYDITVTARSTGGAEVRMLRSLQTVAIPVFQFGVFSENDLSFFAGPDFNFGGRVHTNSNLYLAEGNTNDLTLSDRVTAVGEVVRANLSNGYSTGTSYTGNVRMLQSGSTYRNLAQNEGSVLTDATSAVNPNWSTLSIGTYNGNIRNWRTGTKRLDLPLVSQGAFPIDIVRRPALNSNENVVAKQLYVQRFYGQASLRILLSDTVANITGLPTVSATAPVPLDGTATAAQLTVDATHPPLAVSAGPRATQATANVNNGTGKAISVAAGGVVAMLPTLKIGATTITCGGKDATHFLNCAAGVPANAGTGIVVSSVGFSTTTTAATVANAASITVASTAAFVPLPFFDGDDIITCTGATFTPTQFTGCDVQVASGSIQNNDILTSAALSTAGQPSINGFIKIERQNAAGAWTDVTTEILNLGFSAPNQDGSICPDPTPNAIVRLQRLRDNASSTACGYSAAGAPSQKATDYWPNVLYDTREGNLRDAGIAAKAIAIGGIMNYVQIDVLNLKKWFAGTIGTTGTQAKNDNGYILYFSDRRNNRNAAGAETGEYGFEDTVTPAVQSGTPDGVLQPGEDANGNGTLEVYGATPPAATLPVGATAPFTAAARPQMTVVGGVTITAAHASVNRQILFRRALKLTNGGLGNLPPTAGAGGFTVAAENPIYVQGNYNSLATDTSTDASNLHRPASIIADAVTMLSNAWNDTRSLQNPNDPGTRAATTTGYRTAIISGKTPSFKQPTWAGVSQDFGTDGGAHNFLRYIEGWGSATLNYRGSIVSFFMARQATGSFKCCTTVYGPPTRGYNFDTEFLTPALLPPGTPMFRDVNTLTFRQMLRPNQ